MSEVTEVNGNLRGELERIAARVGEDHPDLAKALRMARLDVCRLEAREHVVRLDNDTAQSELAALREELAMTSALLEASNESHIDWRKKLTAVEQRNAVMTDALQNLSALIGRPLNGPQATQDELLEIIWSAAQPTESGASE